MGRRTITATLAFGLTAGLIAPSAQAVPDAHVGVKARAVPAAPMVLTAAKKASKGRLSVKVRGSGTYTVTGKKVRKSARTSRVFKLKAGRYVVKAPGGVVKPGKVRVKRGKTARVKVRFSTTGSPPPGEPTSPPSPSPSTPPGGPVQQWVQAGSAATVSVSGGYSISIPAGVLQESAVVSVTPLPAAAGGLPGADFNIAGAWSGNVQVTLPAVEPGSDPVVLHEASDGLRITSGNGAQPGAAGGVPTVTASVTSLSPFYSAAVDCSSLSETAQSLMCANQTDQKFADLLTATGTHAAKPVQAGKATTAAVSSDCPNSTLGMKSSGDLAKGIACSESIDGSWGQWGFTNTNHASYLGGLYSAGAVYSMNVTGAFDRSVDRPDDIPFILWPLYEPMKNWYVFPRQRTKIRKTTGSGVSTVSTYPDPGVTPLWASTGFLIGLVGGELIDDLVTDPNLNFEARVKACVPQGSMSLSATVVSCLKNTIIESLEYYAKHASIGKKAKVAATLAKVLAGGDVLMVGASFWRALKAQIDSGLENRLNLEKVEVNTGIDPPSHPKTINSYIARDPDTGRSVLVDRGRVTMIGNGGLFNCLARTRAVWDVSNLKALKQTADGVQMSCYDEGPAWSYTPTASGGNTGTGIILRDTSTTPHSNYLINSAGEIQPITSGGTYLCLAASNPVIWNTPEGKINAWTPSATESARCGRNSRPVLTAGGYHNCWIDGTGAAQCWGDDTYGQVGDGDDNNYWKFAPVEVAGAHRFANLAAGLHHTCGLDSTGAAWCWGSDRTGQAGDGEGNQGNKYSPVPVAGGHTFRSLTAGGDYYNEWGGGHTCGIDSAGAAWCWGSDRTGQAGDGEASQATKYSPVRVAGGHTFNALAAGASHTCGIDSAGAAWCWGSDSEGQIGDGEASQATKYSPVRVAGGHIFNSIATGALHTCGVDTAGTAWCWGSDSEGQIGDGPEDPTNRYLPVRVAGGHIFSTLAAGLRHTCGIDTTGGAWCWGSDYEGQLGDGDTDSSNRYVPGKAAATHTFGHLSAALYRTVGIDASGSIREWGVYT